MSAATTATAITTPPDLKVEPLSPVRSSGGGDDYNDDNDNNDDH